jgi:hypothetical protein
MPTKTLPQPVAPTQQQRLIHDLGNTLSAARLRLDMVLNDPQCSEKIRTNLLALATALDTARRSADTLETSLWGEPADPQTPSK